MTADLRRDLFWSYTASAAKVGSWVIVSAMLYRTSPVEFAMFAMLRATIGILNYTSLGLVPAMVRMMAQMGSADANRPNVLQVIDPATPAELPTLSYHSPEFPNPRGVVYINGVVAGLLTATAGIIISVVYGIFYNRIHKIPLRFDPDEITAMVIGMGLATVIRLFSEAFGAVLQTRGQIAGDYKVLTATEIIWMLAAVVATVSPWAGQFNAPAAVGTYLAASVGMLFVRYKWADDLLKTDTPTSWRWVNWPILRSILFYGAIITLGQLADYLYAPTDFILINHFFGPLEVANYAPAVQIDAGLLLLVTGLSTVILPRAALAHAGGDSHIVRRYYLKGTLVSAGLLLLAGLAVWACAPLLFRIWLGRDMPETRAILPLILIHTIVGGSSAVGRAILLGTGRAKAFTASVLIAGVGNVVLSYAFVKLGGMGLNGIVLGTIVVVGRCGIWMPWYVWRVTGGAGMIGDEMR